jgi:poly-gamma-glutamate capsule biosynthesis protein CapA/YwtB (metallophosphatase superfamily)
VSSLFSIAALGDISFIGRNADSPSLSVFSEVFPVFKNDDLVIANLESPLVRDGVHISGKCSLHGDPGWANVLKESGISILSLANNHMMDYGKVGLLSTFKSLELAGLSYVGAGRDLKEACKPSFIEVAGKRVAFLGRTSVIVTSPSYAETKKPGVAFLDIEETKEKIKTCKKQSDIVILMMHWGLEEYSYPSPKQRVLARELIDAGVDVILGSHPHVLQGVEFIKNGIVAYSLGNFLFDEFEWTINNTEIEAKKFFSPLSRENREGIILNLTWDTDRKVEVNPIFTRIDNDARVGIDSAPYRGMQFKKLNRKLNHPFYQHWWRIYAVRKEWSLRIKQKVSFGNIIRKMHKLRMRHIKELFGTFQKSAKIASGKTTNPYD